MTVGTGANKINWTNFFTYDKNGNITGINEIRDDVVSSLTYEYDEAGQLTRYNDQKSNRTWVYVYDVGGNIDTKTEYTYTTGVVGGPPIKTYIYGYDDYWKDKLISYDGKSITYDAIGNPTSYDGRSFTWEAGRQLKQTSKAGTTIAYKYNDSGIRTQKTVNGLVTDYTLIDDRVTHEQTGTQKIYYRYDSNGELVSFNIKEGTAADNEYFYVRNIQGDIIGVLDSSGNLVVEYEYDAWGKIIDIVDTSGANIGTINPYRYRGYRYDTETSLYYLQSRYYNPEWGRFINADAAFILEMTQGELLGANLFAYCSNNPVMNVDPSGYIVISPLGMTITLGGVFGGFVSIQYLFDLKNNHGILITIGVGLLTPQVSLTYTAMFVKKKTIYDLKGYGIVVGGGPKLAYSLSVDLIFNKKGLVGGAINMGVGVAIPFDVHGYGTVSVLIPIKAIKFSDAVRMFNRFGYRPIYR